MLNLALTCTNPSPALRPTMSTVVSILDGKNSESLSAMKLTASSSSVDKFEAFEIFSDDRKSASLSISERRFDSSMSVQSN